MPYAAAGDLAYGGRLHGLMAGAVFAGRVGLRGACLARAGDLLLLSRCRGGRVEAEIYYHDAPGLRQLDSRLWSLVGARRASLEAVHGDLVFPVEAHVVEAPATSRVERWVRLLLLIPPAAPPPAQPLASYPVEALGVEPCADGRLFCRGGEGEAVAADLVVSGERLSSWLEELGAALAPVAARSRPLGLSLYAHAPVQRGR
ncbi:hypothetical protein CF15_01160 [Pyrodictium occultum]|uniref:Uncharacterized protein n=1 Tax=Pyrodictium occultum TaxID=2309 RepID=A0A0V8RTU1_PYROC|nr:hypothetical protein CF15_01160 [Pyrodictium occultum]